MLNFIKNFRNDEDGAVTVDWVVLTAAIVVLGLTVGGMISRGSEDLGGRIETQLKAMPTSAGP